MVHNLIERCVPGLNIDPDELLVGDRTFLISAIRVVSLGQDYEFPVNCDHCHQEFQYTAKIPDDLEIIYLQDSFQEPFEVELPVSKARVELRCLRGTDERDIARYSEKVYRKVDVTRDGDPTHTYRMARHIVSYEVNGKVHENKTAGDMGPACEFFNSLVALDGVAFRDALSENDCGLDPDIHLTCHRCREQFTLMMPMKAEFFRPGGRKRVKYI
jgi:hypothetical protein